MSMYTIVDFQSKEPVEPRDLIFCDGDRPWEVLMDLNEVRSRLNLDYFRKSAPVVSKYMPFFPIKDYSGFVSLNEGSTPLLKSKHLGKLLGIDLYFKPEFQNPTGSFKDRGSAVELTVAKELNAKAIAVASTGNMAASCSCYAAAAEIPCFVFVPEDTPSSKLSQVISFGGKIVQVKGDYNQAARLAEEVARDRGFYFAGDYAFRVEGQKTGAFEIIDQLFYRVPDYVVIPIGCGTNMAGYAKGFQEYASLGLIDRVPRLVGTQARGANSVVRAFEKGLAEAETLDSLKTIASAIAVTRPLDGIKALAGIRESQGAALDVDDREILEAQYLLSREEGLFVEASAATSIAGIKKMVERGYDIKGTVVCVLTGDGLKDPSPMLRMAVKPPTIHASVESFVSLFERDFFKGRTVSFTDSETVLFKDIPTTEEVEDALKQGFDLTFPPGFVRKVEDGVARFLKKGKQVSMKDFQDIVQDLFGSSDEAERRVEVLDFEVSTGKDRKPQASVRVLVDGVEYNASGEGVGPVDAVIVALRSACQQRLSFRLSNYNVVIRSQGTDAVVFTEMKLEHGGHTSIGRGTSPDIIQASIEAFEHAYNGLVG